MNNTLENNSLQRLKLEFEQTPNDMERIADAIAHNFVRQYEKVVLFVNKAGLLHKLRFGRRS